MPRYQDSGSNDAAALREACASLEKMKHNDEDQAKQEKLPRIIIEMERTLKDKERQQRYLDSHREPDLLTGLRSGESSRLNPLRRYKFFDKDNRRLIMSHDQDLYEPSRHPDLLLYDPSRPMPNLLLRLWGPPLSILVDILQYPPPPIAGSTQPFSFPKDWIHAQALFLDQELSSRRHPVYKYHFLTMDGLNSSSMPEDFMVMFARDIPPWIMRKMDNWRQCCEIGRHNQLNHYLLGWCWFWLQMEVTQRVDRIRMFVLEDEYERLKGKEGRERERERVRREMEEEEDETNPFRRFGLKKKEALREARNFVERISDIGALWFPDSEKKGKFEKYIGDAIHPRYKLSGEGNTREYCVACNLSVVAGSGEEVLTALMANMIARAPCKNQENVTEENGGLPRLYPLVDAWIENLGKERAKAVKAKAAKLALTLFVIRKYLRWKKTPQGRDKWLYMNEEKEEKKNTLPPARETRYLEPVPENSSWSSISPSRHPPNSSSSRHPPSSSSSSRNNRERESYSSKHAVPLSFYNLSNSQVSPAPAPIPSKMVRDHGTGTRKNSETSTAFVRTREYPSETWDFESGSDSETFEFDGDAATTHNRDGDGDGDNDDGDNDMEIMSIVTWSHLSAVPEGLNLNLKGKEKLKEREEREKYRMERTRDMERYRHEGDSLVSSSKPSSSRPPRSERKSTDTRDFASGSDDDRKLDRERYRHEGGRHGPSSSSSRHTTRRNGGDRDRDRDRQRQRQSKRRGRES
ncbi:hypothetical protein B0T09DRAFT_397621 [Sordaria sp. MPI-SDFR-AT-0083]|nr:hypothetical protein B0T09DRAFT_397621 [Sordaria sp. MPI-SDFR-AT-0083]